MVVSIEDQQLLAKAAFVEDQFRGLDHEIDRQVAPRHQLQHDIASRKDWAARRPSNSSVLDERRRANATRIA